MTSSFNVAVVLHSQYSWQQGRVLLEGGWLKSAGLNSAPEGVELSVWMRSEKQSWRERGFTPVLKGGARAHFGTE